MSEREYIDVVLARMYQDIENQIYMTDDERELFLLATLFITTGKNIMVQMKGIRATRDLFDNLDLRKR